MGTGGNTGSIRAVYLPTRSRVTIRNMRIANFADGIYLFNSDNNTILNDEVSSSAASGVVLTNDSEFNIVQNVVSNNNTTGFRTYVSSDNDIRNSTFNNNAGTGIYLWSNDRGELTNNTISGNVNNGIYIAATDHLLMRGNVIAGSKSNFSINSSSGIKSNVVKNYTHDIDTSNTVDGKPIIYLRGVMGRTITPADNPGVIICLACGNIVIDGITIGDNYTSITLVNTTNSVIRNSNIANTRFGIALNFSDGVEITGNTISESNYGVYVLRSPRSNVHDNTVTVTGNDGIHLSDAVDSKVENNIINNVGITSATGISSHKDKSMAPTNLLIRGNTVSGFPTGGITVGGDDQETTNDQIIGNRLDNNRYGIGVTSSYNTTSDNIITGMQTGILVRAFGGTPTRGNVFNGNRIENASQFGIQLVPGKNVNDNQPFPTTCRENQVYNNDLINNVVQISAKDCDPSNIFNLPLPNGGNYWSDFDEPSEGCVDVDSNGFCDSPRVFPGGQDNLPSVRPFTQEEPQVIDPVIIIPGILGSAQKDGIWVIDPIFHTYDNLIDTLVANGYTKGVDLFTFPYDWRFSNESTAGLLRAKINEVQEICQCDKVDLVAHSMGGLVARSLIQSTVYEHDVDQLIFLGTPHLGSPKAYLMWEGGEFPSGFVDQTIKFILSREAKRSGFANLFDYVQNKPITSVQQLLPTLNYLKDKNTGILRSYPTNYPVNNFLNNLNNNVSNLISSGVQITNLVGSTTTAPTIGIIRVVPSTTLPLWQHGYPDGFNEKIGDRGLENEPGDGTVPLASAEYINQDLTILPSDHTGIVTDGEATVYNKITGKTASTLITSNGFDFSSGKFLIIKLLSPVDMQVIAPDGKKIGKDFVTEQEINEIPNAFYSGFSTDDEYVTILNPLSGEYKVVVQGTGTGEYTVATGYMSDDFYVDHDFTAQTQPGLESEMDVSVTSTGDLEVAPQDQTPPVITVFSPGAHNYTRSNSFVADISATDASGIFSQAITLDGEVIINGQTINLTNFSLGSHTLVAEATDFVGNTASTSIVFQVTVTKISLIDTINLLYAQKLITNDGIRKSLVVKVQSNAYQALLNELKAQKGKFIKEGAYQKLLEEVTWIINH